LPLLQQARPVRRVLAVILLGLLVAGAGAAFHYRRLLWPDPRGAHVTRFRIQSRLLHRSVQEIVVSPRGGGRGRPVLCSCMVATASRATS
jgi:hypothetical protein